MAKVTFIGLGAMGFPMAGHLASGGHEVTIFARRAEVATAWLAQHAGRAAPDPASAARETEVVFLCVSNDAAVRALFDDIAPAMGPGGIIVDHSTTSATLARALAQAASEAGLAFVDAPVSGGQSGAQAGKLTTMLGGEASAVERVRPLLACYAATIVHIGPAGAGQLAKMANQICVAGCVEAVAEALHFAEAAGIDLDAVHSAITKGAAQSWQLDNRWGTMAQRRFDFGFAVDWMRKDLAIVLEEARANGAQLPTTAIIEQFYARLQARGAGRFDSSSLVTLFEPGPVGR
jgi:3-hydroxyisobutyrate dehydrogenase